MNTKSKRAVLAVILLFLVLLAFALVYQNRERETDPISKTDYLLNTIVTVTLYDSQDESILDGTLELCRKYDNLLSPTTETSELYRLNHGELSQDEEGFFRKSRVFLDIRIEKYCICLKTVCART